MTRAALVVLLVACGRIGFDEGGGSGASPCSSFQPPDLSNATVVTSCDEASLRAAVTVGGVIRLSCGTATIPVASELLIASDTVIDAGGVTFDGQNQTRIFHVPPQGARFTLMNATLINGRATTSGGAILIEAGALEVFSTSFQNNAAVPLSSFEGGGAIAALPPSASVAAYDCSFDNNRAANGGAMQVFGDLTIVTSTVTSNTATGTGGPMAQGGIGGAIHATGTGDLTLCAVQILLNTAGDYGGGIQRVSIDGTGVDRWDRVRLESNRAAGGGGAAYLQDTTLRVRQSSVIGNVGAFGGLWVQNTQRFEGENLTIADNRSTAGLGAGLRIAGPGSLAFSTVANNWAMCPTCFSAAIDAGANVTLTSSIVANNVADGNGGSESCRLNLIDGGTNFQWPNEPSLCASGVRVEDPLLAASALMAGPAGSFIVVSPNAGSPVIGVASSCPTQDALGKPRPTPCAAGSVEP